MDIFAKRIKDLRKDKGLTLLQLGEKLNVSYGTVAWWENKKGLPSVPVLIRIADFFNVTLDYLVGRTEY